MSDPRGPVPFLDLRAQYAGLRGEIRAALDDLFERQAFVLGEPVAALEREVAAFLEARRAVGCASGSDALLLVLHALGVGPGDEVICPSFTFFATAGAVARLGARPVFADIDPASYCLDPAAARAAAARCRRLRAIVAVHLYGRAADNDALLALAAEHGVPLVEDAAQAIGARDASGRRVGARGRAACLSFYPTKNLGGAGDGGMVTTDDDALAERLARLRVHGSPRRYEHDELGMNSRLDALQAAVLRVKLGRLEAWNAARRAHARAYDEAFAKAGARPSSVPLAAGGLPLRTPEPPAPPAESACHLYVVRVPRTRREALRAHLGAAGIGCDVYYPLGLHQQRCFAEAAREARLPHTEDAAAEVLALPLYPELRDEQREQVVEAVLAGLGG
ncbi:MAG: DegT/DnrJ/EryC1/StrS family aminotransferase [Deltaproteobacteria bacterium]|nr:DegT/DnrJ/EryC1/StrS family aminotransferase [Deltaproteobacteria bacterium]